MSDPSLGGKAEGPAESSLQSPTREYLGHLGIWSKWLLSHCAAPPFLFPSGVSRASICFLGIS